jgi:hypothetical protein
MIINSIPATQFYFRAGSRKLATTTQTKCVSCFFNVEARIVRKYIDSNRPGVETTLSNAISADGEHSALPVKAEVKAEKKEGSAKWQKSCQRQLPIGLERV